MIDGELIALILALLFMGAGLVTRGALWWLVASVATVSWAVQSENSNLGYIALAMVCLVQLPMFIRSLRS